MAKIRVFLGTLVLLTAVLVVGCERSAPTPAPTSTPVAQPTATATVMPAVSLREIQYGVIGPADHPALKEMPWPWLVISVQVQEDPESIQWLFEVGNTSDKPKTLQVDVGTLRVNTQEGVEWVYEKWINEDPVPLARVWQEIRVPSGENRIVRAKVTFPSGARGDLKFIPLIVWNVIVDGA